MSNKYSLVVIDVQDSFLNSLKAEVQALLEGAVSAIIDQAKQGDLGIVVFEYDPEIYGKSSEFLLDLLEGYNKCVRLKHYQRSVGREALATIHQQSFCDKLVKVCGVYRYGSVKETAEEINYLSNFQIETTIIESACVCANSTFSRTIG